MVKVAINGFGRIGRAAFRRISCNYPSLEVVAINDLTDTKTLAHLLKYDSLYGSFQKPVKARQNSLVVGDKDVEVLAEKDPARLPWKKLKVDIVLECTGRFSEFDGASLHLKAGAKKVIISTPSKSEEVKTFVLGVNEEAYDPKKDNVVSMASCTTNCLAPIAKLLHDNCKIKKGFMSTIHSYTNDQRILDLPHKDLRRARAAALNIIPTSTGAASAIGKVIPEIEGRLDGIAFRVPTPVVSVLDLICEVEKPMTPEELNFAFKKASKTERLQGIFGVEDAQLVSSDYIGNSFSSVLDASLTMVIGNLVKLVAWYDNEWAYACRLAGLADYIGKKI